MMQRGNKYNLGDGVETIRWSVGARFRLRDRDERERELLLLLLVSCVCFDL